MVEGVFGLSDDVTAGAATSAVPASLPDGLDDPKKMFAWMFAAGVPDPRGDGRFPNQPLIPPPCYGVLSEMLYKMGARFHPELQELWVKPRSGPGGNFVAAGTTDVKPADVAEMLVDQFPAVAAKVAAVTPDTHAAALAEQSQALLDSVAKLKAAREQMDAAHAAGGGGAS